MRILVSGGAGFIGSALCRYLVGEIGAEVLNYDKLTYAGNLASLKPVENAPNYHFIKADICDFEILQKTINEFKPNHIMHLAAESHVDRSITGSKAFIETNVMGSFNMLEAARQYWNGLEGDEKANFRFLHVSTDEVYGALEFDGSFFTESTKYDPHSPYSASKASSDHFVRAYNDTYGLPVVISNCSNNYGANHFPEKLIPLSINNIKHNKPIPIYGKGENVRDWLWVNDHARAIDIIFHNGKNGQTYNIGGNNEWSNIELIHKLCEIMDRKLGREQGESAKLITFVKDRAGHDLRYAIDSSKLQNELGWKPSLQFEEGLEKTVDWYLENQEWLDNVTSGQYQNYYEKQYKERQ